MLFYWEGNLLGPIAGDVMGGILLEGLSVIISCTPVAPTLVAQIFEQREAAHRVGIVDPHPALMQEIPTTDRSPGINLEQEVLQIRLKQVARNESELFQHLEQYAPQQDHVIWIVTHIGKKIQQLETPSNSDKPNRVPSTPLPSHSTSVWLGSQHQFQVKAEFDFGKFSRNDPTPSGQLNFYQWYVNVKASQQQYPDVLLPAFTKYLKGPVASIVWYLGPNFLVESACKALYQEYKCVTSSDVIYQEFFQLKQLSKDKVQVYAIHLHDILARLKNRFPNKFF